MPIHIVKSTPPVPSKKPVFGKKDDEDDWETDPDFVVCYTHIFYFNLMLNVKSVINDYS